MLEHRNVRVWVQVFHWVVRAKPEITTTTWHLAMSISRQCQSSHLETTTWHLISIINTHSFFISQADDGANSSKSIKSSYPNLFRVIKKFPFLLFYINHWLTSYEKISPHLSLSLSLSLPLNQTPTQILHILIHVTHPLFCSLYASLIYINKITFTIKWTWSTIFMLVWVRYIHVYTHIHVI